MQSPRVGKSPVGHLNALVGSGLRSYTYPGKASQLLGYKQSFPATLQHEKLPGINDIAFNYLERTTDLIDTHLADEVNARNPDNINPSHSVLPAADEGSERFGKKQQQQLTPNSKIENSSAQQATLPERNSIDAARVLPAAHLTDTHLATTQPGNTQPANTQPANTQPGNTPLPGKYFSPANSSPAQLPILPANRLVSDFQDNTSTTPKNENMDASGKAEAPSAKSSRSNISNVQTSENSFSLEARKNNHSILHKRYQAMLDNPDLPSRFNADPKTRAAIARMQERLANSHANSSDAKPVEMTATDTANKNALPSLKKNTQTPLNFQQPVKNDVVEISKAITNNFQHFPTANVYRNVESRKQAGKLEKLESELARQKDIVARMSAENRRYQAQLAKLESQQKNSSDTHKRDSGSSTFWAKNRLTHAMLRIQS